MKVKTEHPKGLYRCFWVEMWERFSYYGMRALLVLYMVNYHGWQPAEASKVYKWYTSLVYLTPLIGGFIADRFIGLRMSIIIGGSLMMIGHFLMAFEDIPIFFTALGFLIAGNGFFKPNMSTLIGKMYPEGDPRRDSGFTIFYMGINLGALIAPIACGLAKKHFGFHYGFTLAGIGMAVGLIWFLVSQRQIIADVEAAGHTLKGVGKGKDAEVKDDPYEEKPAAGGVAGLVSFGFRIFLILVGIILPGVYIYFYTRGDIPASDLIMPIAFGIIFLWMSYTLFRLRGAAQDRGVAIFIFFFFSVLFWMAFEQAGNTLNIWADHHTNRKLFGWTYPAEFWQALNPLLILILAPLYAKLWIWLAQRDKEPATATKMFLGLFLMTFSFVPMVIAAQLESRTKTTIKLEKLPQKISQKDLKEVFVGRLSFEEKKGQLTVNGTFPSYVSDKLLLKTVSEEFKKEVESLDDLSRKATEKNPIKYTFKHLPEGFVFPYSKEAAERIQKFGISPEKVKEMGFDPQTAKELGLSWDPKTKTLTMTKHLEKPTRRRLTAAGGDPTWRDTLWALEIKSQRARVSSIWLFLTYLFATLGELCLSPVGLSMVTKLAPVKMASVFMGVWLLSSSVAQYAGGDIGEKWGKILPTTYFSIFVLSSLLGALLLLLLNIPLKKLMHDVH